MKRVWFIALAAIIFLALFYTSETYLHPKTTTFAISSSCSLSNTDGVIPQSTQSTPLSITYDSLPLQGLNILPSDTEITLEKQLLSPEYHTTYDQKIDLNKISPTTQPSDKECYYYTFSYQRKSSVPITYQLTKDSESCTYPQPSDLSQLSLFGGISEDDINNAWSSTSSKLTICPERSSCQDSLSCNINILDGKTSYYGIKVQKDPCNNYLIQPDNDGNPISENELTGKANDFLQECNPSLAIVDKTSRTMKEIESVRCEQPCVDDGSGINPDKQCRGNSNGRSTCDLDSSGITGICKCIYPYSICNGWGDCVQSVEENSCLGKPDYTACKDSNHYCFSQICQLAKQCGDFCTKTVECASGLFCNIPPAVSQSSSSGFQCTTGNAVQGSGTCQKNPSSCPKGKVNPDGCTCTQPESSDSRCEGKTSGESCALGGNTQTFAFCDSNLKCTPCGELGQSCCPAKNENEFLGIICQGNLYCNKTAQKCVFPKEICNDNIDNNGNNQIDCADEDCAYDSYCYHLPTTYSYCYQHDLDLAKLIQCSESKKTSTLGLQVSCLGKVDEEDCYNIGGAGMYNPISRDVLVCNEKFGSGSNYGLSKILRHEVIHSITMCGDACRTPPGEYSDPPGYSGGCCFKRLIHETIAFMCEKYDPNNPPSDKIEYVSEAQGSVGGAPDSALLNCPKSIWFNPDGSSRISGSAFENGGEYAEWYNDWWNKNKNICGAVHECVLN